MKSKQVSGGACRIRIFLFTTLSLAAVAVIIIPGLAARRGGEPRENVAQEINKVVLSVEDTRPVAKAILLLEAEYGWIITYEDPRYVYADDIADVTEKVRRDLHKYREGAAPRILVPKGGELTFEYYVGSPNYRLILKSLCSSY